jgi:arsenate reductase
VARIYEVLFLCRDNSATSIMAEALLRHWGAGRFHAQSAGVEPAGSVNPMAAEQILRGGLSPGDYQPKGVETMLDRGAQPDFVFTLHDPRGATPPPEWPGRPAAIVWPVLDPTTFEGDEATRRGVFRTAYLVIENRIKLLTSLRPEMLDRLVEHARLHEISIVPKHETG